MKKLLIIGTNTCLIVLATSWAFKLWTPSHEKIHPSLPPHSFYPFTLTESDARIPCLQAEIEGIPFLAKLDIGYDGVLSLPKHLLEQLAHKRDAETVLFKGIKGGEYESPVFTLPQLNIGDLTLMDFPAEETNLEFERDTNLGIHTDPPDAIARIGWRAFFGTVVLIDFNKGIGACCDSLETLKEQGYPLEQFVSTNLLPGEQYVGFEADIGNRKIKCILDTGCTLNLINTLSTDEESEFGSVDLDNPLPSSVLSIGGRDLGPCVFYKTPLPFGVEAIIGVDFLETQIICIDLVNNTLHLCPVPEEDSLDQVNSGISSPLYSENE